MPDCITEYKALMRNKYPLLEDVYDVADGLKLHLEQADDNKVQNMFYMARHTTIMLETFSFLLLAV